MKKINSIPMQGMTIDAIENEFSDINTGKYVIYVNLSNGDVNITKNRRGKKDNEFIIGEVELNGNSKKKFIKKFSTDVRHTIRDYHTNRLITKTRAISTFGKEYIGGFKPVLELKNPYYGCAAPMCLFDMNVLLFNRKEL